VLPDRLEFYEEWLDPAALRNGTVGLAPLSAVTGFLRTEGDGYRRVVAQAGVLAARWTIDAVPTYRRRIAASMPAAVRLRLALRVAKRVARDIRPAGLATSQVARRRATLQVDASVFCRVRERSDVPLCGFYQALVGEALRAFRIQAETTIQSCRAVAGGSCVIAVEIGAHGQADPPAMAA
jgi:hypothetical protein